MNHLDMDMELKDRIELEGSKLDHLHTLHYDSKFARDRKRYIRHQCNLMELPPCYRKLSCSPHKHCFHKEHKQLAYQVDKEELKMSTLDPKDLQHKHP